MVVCTRVRLNPLQAPCLTVLMEEVNKKSNDAVSEVVSIDTYTGFFTPM